ncbi:hypothetical protein Ptr902_01185 [Pyrenophora tritici-repentis]|nr:hypothetical protein Ptr902_01185 [Pyrenophora tritici-repentis]
MAPESSPEFLPNQNARLPSRTTASEFTAMADENPVAAELEEVPGIELERPWPSMNIQE